ncbi:MAG: hypothetical protein V1682_02985 [Candidatus Omnitrophota bacterium]
MNKRNLAGQLIFCILAFTAVAEAGDDITLRSSADRRSITIGDRIVYTIEVTAPGGTEVQMPSFANKTIGDFEIKDSNVKASRRLFGRKSYRNRYKITAYVPGKSDIPQLEVKYKPKGAKDWASRKTAAIPIDVKSVLPKELPADIKDIKPPMSYFELNLLLTFGALFVMIIVAVVFFIVKRARSRRPVRLPHETALEELLAARSQLTNSGDVKEYFVNISDCVRRYIERVFALKAPEMTTEEFLNSLGDSAKLALHHKDLLRGFMNACDLVKFAKYRPTGEETGNLYETAVNFVNETKEVK